MGRIVQESLIRIRQNTVQFWERLGPWGHGLVYFILMTPFAVLRHVRIHGDEKVYVGQALEMVRAGHFWQQLQFGDVNYIKGPVHYLLLILGHHLFGFSMLATVYMNLIFAALAIVALRVAADHLFPKNRLYRAVPAWIFASSGVFVFFSFSSQMESQLTSFYALALALAVIARHQQRTIFYFLMWLTVGLAGALKSPLHSCLLGVSVLLYFALIGELKSSLFASMKNLGSLSFGVLICGAGYLIPFVFDESRWLSTYLFREQIDRPRFADSGSEFLLNNFFLHFFPWCFLVLHGFWLAVRRLKAREYVFDELTKVSLAFILPTFIFFYGLGYRASWYGLPMTPAIALLVWGQFEAHAEPLKKLASAVLPWAVVMMGVVLLGHAVFFDGTAWWTWGVSLLLSSVFLASFFILAFVVDNRISVARPVTFAGVCLFWCATLGLSGVLGGAELHDVQELTSRHSAPLNYSNTKRENYSEWGYMAYMTGRPTYFSTSHEELYSAGLRGNLLVFTKKDELDAFWSWMSSSGRKNSLAGEPEVHLWRRWPRNAGQLKDTWIERTSTENLWDKVARHFYVVKFQDPKGSALAGPL